MKLLQISTAVLMAPSRISMSALPSSKACGIVHAVNREGHEQAAKQHDFGHEEDPHADGGRFPLLSGVANCSRSSSGTGSGTRSSSSFIAS